MTTYAIGDIQGCYDSLRALLDKLAFDPAQDRLWLVGDLVNRGPKSLETLRFVRGLGDAVVTVLGNHDLALLAKGYHDDALERVNDTLRPIIRAPDCRKLLDWLRHRPLFHHDATLGWAMVHGGLAPQWTIADAAVYADEVAAVLQSDQHQDFFQHMYGNQPDHWNPALAGWDRARVITNYLTRTRLCHPDGSLDLQHKGPLADAPAGTRPWFTLPGRASRHSRIVFGHWSALGRVAWPDHNVWGIDSGCVWGKRLTALKLDDIPQLTSIACCE